MTTTPLEAQVFPFGMRVLVVDHDLVYLKTLEMMLIACSYRVFACNSAKGALELLEGRNETFDILITEVHLPEMDGFQLLDHISFKFGLPVILMSYDGTKSSILRGVNLRASDYMLKPLRMEELRLIWQHVYRKWTRELKELESYVDISTGFLSNKECAVSSCKKRKQMDGKPDANPTNSVKKARIIWTPDLEDKFLQAVNEIGLTKVTPKKIQQSMNVSWLTLGHISSHLQKYRNDLKIAKNNKELHHPGKILQQQPALSMLTEVAAAFDDGLLNGGQISLKDYESSNLLDISEGGFLYSQVSQPISSSTVTTENQSFASCSSTDMGSSQENSSLSDNSIYTQPNEVIQVDWSMSLDDLDIQWTEYDQGLPINSMPCR